LRGCAQAANLKPDGIKANFLVPFAMAAKADLGSCVLASFRRAAHSDHRGTSARADQGPDVGAHAGEGIAAALPSLILVVASDEVGADVADGVFGDFLGHTEPAHHQAD
jgi:hypothetical protein